FFIFMSMCKAPFVVCGWLWCGVHEDVGGELEAPLADSLVLSYSEGHLCLAVFLAKTVGPRQVCMCLSSWLILVCVCVCVCRVGGGCLYFELMSNTIILMCRVV